jgi:hypothetical protein
MYIKITNETEGFSRLYLELLGVSTKRDNDDTIGQFGSGTKFAPIHALRNGWEWVSTGHDDDGLYTMSYKIDSDNAAGIEIVQFVYEDEDGVVTTKDSSYSTGAGELGWDTSFQIFREAFANALDAHYEFDASYWIDVVDEIGEPVWGEFSVYITADDDLRDIKRNFDRYFSIDRTDVIFEDELGSKMLTKLPGETDGGARIYHKGVLVYGPELGGSSVTSLYDYDLDKVVLNEERTLKNMSGNEGKCIAELFGGNLKYNNDGIDVVVHDLIDNLKYDKGLETFEWKFMPYQFTMSTWNEWTEADDANAFGKVFTDAAKDEYADDVTPDVAYVSEENGAYAEIAMKLKERGYVGLVVSKAMYNLLETTGADENMDKNILGTEFDHEFISLESKDQRFLDLAQETLISYDMDIMCYPIKVIKATARNKHIMGKAVREDGNEFIFLNEALIKSRNMKQLIGTMVHELDHLISNADDGSREFRDAADNRLGDLILKHYCDKSNLLEIIREE